MHSIWGLVHPIGDLLHLIWGPVYPIGESSVSKMGCSTSYGVLLSWSPLVSTRRISKNDWVEWLCQLGVELLKESPSPTLCSCFPILSNISPERRLHGTKVLQDCIIMFVSV